MSDERQNRPISSADKIAG